MKKLTLTIAAFIISFSLLAQHTVHLKSGVEVKGYVTSLQKGVLSLDADGKMMTYPISEVKSVDFESGESNASGAVTEKKAISSDGNYEIFYSVRDREIVKPPRIQIGTQDKGTVVVRVVVDKYGNVTSAEPGAPGSSTTNDDYLFTKAEAFAQQIKFNRVPTAPLQTRGTVRFEF